MTFDFSVPITWADIINFISTVVAFVAVIVAIVANCKAKESLEYSLKMQEQSKNVDLFEKRVAIIEALKEEKLISEISLKLLFENSVFEEYKKLQKIREEKKSAEHDMRVYELCVQVSDGVGGYLNPIEDIRALEYKIEHYGETEENKKEFEELCEKHQITYSEFGEPERSKIYNYIDLSRKIGDKNLEAENQLKKLLEKMEKEIAESISSLD